MYDLRLQAPFTMQIVGQTGAGKSQFCSRLIENSSVMINPPPERLIYAYGEWQPMFAEMKGVEFVKGITEDLISRENLGGKRTLLVIDDLSDEVSEKLIGGLFTKFSHHRQICVLFLVNNLFFRGLKNYRLISVNTHYFVIFRSSRDKSSITILARQMWGRNYKMMEQAYDDAVKRDFGYLFIDLKPGTKKALRLRTNIFPSEQTVCYVIKDG